MKNQNKTILMKTFSILLILSFVFSFFGKANYTFAYFSDSATSSGNTFSAGTLDFSLRSGQNNFVPPETAGDMGPGDSVARDIYIKKQGTLPFKYRAKSFSIDSNCGLDFYNLLELKVWYNWYDETGKNMSLKYNGSLKEFEMNFDGNDEDLRIPNNHPYFDNNFYEENEHWLYFYITYPDDEKKLVGLKCEFDFVFDAWQENISYGQGFFDSGKISNILVDSIALTDEDIFEEKQENKEGNTATVTETSISTSTNTSTDVGTSTNVGTTNTSTSTDTDTAASTSIDISTSTDADVSTSTSTDADIGAGNDEEDELIDEDVDTDTDITETDDNVSDKESGDEEINNEEDEEQEEEDDDDEEEL